MKINAHALANANKEIVHISWDVHQAYLGTALGLELYKWDEAPDTLKNDHVEFVKLVIDTISVNEAPMVTNLPSKKVVVACINSLVKNLASY